MNPPGFSPRAVLKDAGVFCALAVGALTTGFLLNLARSTPLPWKYESRDLRLRHALDHLGVPTGTPPPAAARPATPRLIDLEEFQQVATGGKAIVLDARAGTFYRLGHVPGALNLSRENFEHDYAVLRGTLPAQGKEPIAVYCTEPHCPDAQLVADALQKLGYGNILIYPDGWEQWQEAGLPQEPSKGQP